jgi:protease-4
MKTFLNSFAGALAAILFLVAVAGGYGSCAANRVSKIEADSWLVVELNDALPEYDPPGGVLSSVTQGDTETLQRVLDNLAKVVVDERIKGVVLKVGRGSRMGWASAGEIRDAVDKVQEAGKKVYGWGESFDAGNYMLMAAADEIYAPPTAQITFTGFAASSIHVKNALDKLGINPGAHKIKDYKAAAEMVMRENMSEPARENRAWLLDERWKEFMGIMAADRGQNEATITGFMEHAIFTGDQALEAGLIDRLMYWDELEELLKDEDGEEWHTVSQKRYAKVEMKDVGLGGGDKVVAVIHAQGTIMGRKNGVNPLLGVTMGFETIAGELRRAREDEDVVAIILRVDSGGGDALTSDFMGHAVEITAAVKPVVVSMVNVAASGGYHISYRSTRILADPMTITGSIGSITGHFNVAEFWGNLGVTSDAVTRGPSALLNSSFSDLDPELRERFEADHWRGFNQWLQDVSEHRGMTFEEAELLAHGRVWSGRQAVANGLVDELGGLSRAVEVARELAGVPAEDSITVSHYPEKKSLLQSLTSDGDKAAAARWLVYRSMRKDISETLDLVASRPDLVLAPLTP